MVSVSVSYCYVTSEHTHTKISVAGRKSIYLALTSPGLCWSQVVCSVHASGAGWRWTDLSGAWLNGSALMAMSGTFHFSLQVCLIFPGPANYPGCVYVITEKRSKREGFIAKARFVSHLLRSLWPKQVYSWSWNEGMGVTWGDCKVTWGGVE